MIFLQILKIIGIVLLAILGVVILLVLLILFVPIRYRIQGEFHGTPKVTAKASFLLHILRAFISYEKEDGLHYYVKVLWISLFSSEDDGSSSKKTSKNIQVVEQPTELEQLLADADPNEEYKIDLSDESSATESTIDKEADQKKKNDKSKKANKKKRKKHKKRKEPLKTRIVNLWEKIKRLYKNWKRILTDERNKEAFSHIKKVLFKILKGIMPKKFKLEAKYSTGSPDTTAEILGVLAMFPICYQNKWKIYPDFDAEKGYFDGDCDIKGRIYIFKILFPALGVVFDKKCRRLFRMVKKLGGFK